MQITINYLQLPSVFCQITNTYTNTQVWLHTSHGSEILVIVMRYFMFSSFVNVIVCTLPACLFLIIDDIIFRGSAGVLWSWVKWLSQAGVCFWAWRGRVCARALPVCFWVEGKSRAWGSISDVQSWPWTQRNHKQTYTQAYHTHPKTQGHTQKAVGAAQRNAFKVDDPTKLTQRYI